MGRIYSDHRCARFDKGHARQIIIEGTALNYNAFPPSKMFDIHGRVNNAVPLQYRYSF